MTGSLFSWTVSRFIKKNCVLTNIWRLNELWDIWRRSYLTLYVYTNSSGNRTQDLLSPALWHLSFFSFTNEDEHDFMHGESLGDFLILFEPWTVVNSVDTGVAVVQVMVACEPSPYVDAASPWHFGYAPFHILWHQSGLCCARLGDLMLALPKHYGQSRNVLERPSVCLWNASFGHL